MKGIFKRNSTNKPSSVTRSSTAPASSTGSTVTGPPRLDRKERARLLQSTDLEIFCAVKSQWDWVLEELCRRTNNNDEGSSTSPKRTLTAVSAVTDLPSAKLASSLQERKVASTWNSNSDGSDTVVDRSFRRQSRPRKVKSLNIPGTFMLCVEVVVKSNNAVTAMAAANNSNSDGNLQAFHGNSEAFDGLEDKDEFVRTLQHCRCEHLELSPPSKLINWDATKDECRNLVGESLPVLLSNSHKKNTDAKDGTADSDSEGQQATTQPPTVRMAVLKEPMGSKGTGVFFVKNADEIHEIIEENRKQATEEPGFLDELIALKGRIPKWVLQAEVTPCLLLRDRRKFHIRTYVVCIEQVLLDVGAGDDDELMKMYIYNRHEVRIASKPVSEDEENASSRDRDAHITQTGDSSERRLLQDVPELVERKMQQMVELFAAQTFAKHIRPDIERRIASAAAMEEQQDESNNEHNNNGTLAHPEKFSLAGLDLMVTEDGRIYLLEVNVNPGVPPRDTIAVDIQDHLVGLLNDLITLVTAGGTRATLNFSTTDEILKRPH